MSLHPLRRPATFVLPTAALLVAGLLTSSAHSAPTRTASPHRAASVTSLGVAPAPAVVQSGSRTTSGRSLVAALAGRRTHGFSMVGVTWDRASGRDVAVQVRTHGRTGWSRWTALDVDPDNDASGTRSGTEPLWVNGSDGVAARVLATGGAPQGVKVVLVDAGTDPAGSSQPAAGRLATSTTTGAPAYTPMPAMFTRAQWGARPNTPCDSPRYGDHTLGVIFHHTAGTNSYSRSQSKAIVRATQAYHMSGRGWCDIGYNFLVDKYGQIFEGRSGGVLQQVRGAHAGNYAVNTYDMGVSMMGNLDRVRPTAAMKTAAVRLIGWRLGTNFLPAKGTYAIAGHRLNRIAGHRDVYNSGIRPGTATACPGRYGIAWMRTGLRDRVAAYISGYTSPIKTETARLGRAVTGYLSAGEYVTEGGRKARFVNGDMYSKGTLGAHFVTGAVDDEYAAWDIQHGALGFPSSDLVMLPSGTKGYQQFEHGTIYQVEQPDISLVAYGLTTGVDTKYRELGSFDSDLGSPTSRVTTTGTVDTATFEHGRIDYDRSTGVATVTYS